VLSLTVYWQFSGSNFRKSHSSNDIEREARVGIDQINSRLRRHFDRFPKMRNLKSY
jgi:hypothetical protein